MIEGAVSRVSKVFASIAEVSIWIASIATVGMVIVVFIDVLGRRFFNSPLIGSYEIVEQAMGIVGGVSIMYAAFRRAHVAIDLVIGRLSARFQTLLQRVFSFLAFGTSIVLAYKIFLWALEELSVGSRTDILRAPRAPLTSAIALALFLCGLIFLARTIRPGSPGETAETME